MCSIMGYCGEGMDYETFRQGFDRTLSRGPDDTRIVDTGMGLLGFHRLAIMDPRPEGMQPFELEGSFVVCNGEIYGFDALRKKLEGKYTFVSDSDCEVLLPLYREYGTDMFRMLDAEFACILFDAESGSYVAARDPIGIRPLYYGRDEKGVMVFASEPKNLVGLVDKIAPFPPGHYYKDGVFVRYADMTRVERPVYDDLDTICQNIREKLIAGVEKRLIADAKVGFLLSGGLDSSLVCAIAAKKSSKPIRTFAIGMDTDAIDLKYAREVAEYIGSDHTEVIISRDDVIEALEPADIRVLLTGEISDELFGYKYTDFAPSAQEFQHEAEKRIRELHMYDVLRADRCISVNSLEARVPFGDLDFVRYVMAIDPEKKRNHYGKGKYLLRRAFEGDYLPTNILYREKAAFSDAVGHSLVNDLKDYAESCYTQKEFAEKCKAYTYAQPFTKESLLYRELFEKYYPGQAEMVAGFWMPNRSWEGCDVDDPSARVLSNYGASGL